MEAFRYPPLFIGIIMTVNALLVQGTFGHNTESCSEGWTAYNEDHPPACVLLSDSKVSSLDTAHKACVDKNASLIVINSDKKFDFFKGIVKSNGIDVWVGLKKSGDGIYWLTKDGLIPATTLPSGLQFSNWNYDPYGYSRREGLIYKPNSLKTADYYSSAQYICEKRPACTKGWFGPGCDRECHCHSQECRSSSPNTKVTCLYGCQVGWMGNDCSQRKDDADVNYFCINSSDQATYAHIMINTKGVHYENIHAVDSNGQWRPWCNNTHIETNQEVSLESIKIYVDDSKGDEINQKNCTGKIADNGHHEWHIRIQEKKGLVSRNDQEVHVECNFKDADNLSLSRKTTLKREKWFRRADVRRPIEYLEETRESVDLNVADPYTGLPVSKTVIGTSVVLKICFDVAKGNLATDAFPYNCYASSPDGDQKVPFVNKNGFACGHDGDRFSECRACPVTGSPVSGFSKNGTKSLITQPFPLFGFDGAKDLEFHCSYVLCFGVEACPEECLQPVDANTTRYRRSAGDTELRLTGKVELIDDMIEWGLGALKLSERLSSTGNSMPTMEHCLLVHLVTTAMVFACRL